MRSSHALKTQTGSVALVALVVIVALMAFGLIVGLAVVGTVQGGGDQGCPGGLSGADAEAIPAKLVAVYKAAATTYGLGPKGPAVLAAINRIETDFGRNVSVSSAGALGWMQFIPSTWSRYAVDANGDGRADPNDSYDAIFTAARYLKASGAPGDWHGALYAYNHAESYVQDVLSHANGYQSQRDASAVCGPAELQRATTLTSPRRYEYLPAWAAAAGWFPAPRCDARIVPDVLWILRTYDLRAQDCLANGHQTHGEGLAIDLVPASDQHPRPGDLRRLDDWQQTVERLAHDLHWGAGCASVGCIGSTVPAIKAIFYNGFSNHGDPKRWFGDSGCACPHIHISWDGAIYFAATIGLPATWVRVFAVPGWTTGSLKGPAV